MILTFGACGELLDEGTYLGQVVQAVQIVRSPELSEGSRRKKEIAEPISPPAKL
jgi:hypothetical protein